MNRGDVVLALSRFAAFCIALYYIFKHIGPALTGIADALHLGAPTREHIIIVFWAFWLIWCVVPSSNSCKRS